MFWLQSILRPSNQPTYIYISIYNHIDIQICAPFFCGSHDDRATHFVYPYSFRSFSFSTSFSRNCYQKSQYNDQHPFQSISSLKALIKLWFYRCVTEKCIQQIPLRSFHCIQLTKVLSISLFLFLFLKSFCFQYF